MQIHRKKSRDYRTAQDVLDHRAAQTKSVGDDAVRLDRTAHSEYVHLSLDNDDFFNQHFTLFTTLSVV